ncbi:MAG: hypothetical protein ACYC2G_12180 [Gemmatimonadaceae bacterium]
MMTIHTRRTSHAAELSAPAASPPRILAAFALALIAGCDYGTVQLTEPAGPPTSGVTVTVRLADADRGLAAALGWAEGAVPGAEVTLWPASYPDDADISPLVDAPELVRVSADDAGAAVLGDQGAGQYRLKARRILSEAEREALAETGWRDVVGVAGIASVRVLGDGSVGVRNPGDESQPGAAVTAVPMRQGGLVLSQWSAGFLHASNTTEYEGGKYLTLYNNGDSTIYLDGVIFATRYSYWELDYPLRPCALSERYRHDEGGVWARTAMRFPGSGGEYPVLPGRGVLLAADAIDHRGKGLDRDGTPSDALFDLRGADFEFLGPADVDNPAVPNMVQVARDPFTTSGHGLFARPDDVVLLWSPEQWESLPRDNDFFDNAPWTRLPTSGRVDAVVFGAMDDSGIGIAFCDYRVARVFDRERARLDSQGFSPVVAYHRRVALTLPDGRVVLQNTRTSAQDWASAPPVPAAAPAMQ